MRKLAVFAFSFSAAIFACNLFLPFAAVWWLAAGFALAGLLTLAARQKWMLGLVLCFFGLSAGLLCYALHAQRTLIPAVELDGETREVRGEILTYPRSGETYCSAEILLNGEDLPHVRALLYCDGTDLASAKPGDRVSCVCTLRRGDMRYGEQYDRYLSRDLYLVASAREAPVICEGGVSLRAIPVNVNHGLSKLVDTIFPSDTAPFMKSLMLGDRSDFYRDEGLYLAMSRSGFMHIIAVSGMHVAFLVGVIQLLLGRTRRSSILCLALVWFFVLVTGASPSALRAAIMQSFLLIAPLVKRENDPATSLSAALALILLFNPFAAMSVSLQLSFAAMAGILCFGESLNGALSGLIPETWAFRLRGPISAAASSLAVLVFTAPLSAIHFQSIAVLSPLTNLLGLWAVSLCFCGGYLSSILGLLFLPAGKLAAWICSWVARYLMFVARTVSSISFASVYVNGILPVVWILLVYSLVICAVLSDLRLWQKWAAPLGLSILTLALLLGVTRQNYRSGSGVISVIDVGQGQCIAVISGDETMMIDCGGIFTTENAGSVAGEYLRSCGRDHVDVMILTHLHADHCNGFAMLQEMAPVGRLILPADASDEDGMLEQILASAQEHGTGIEWIGQDTKLSLGGIRADLFAPVDRGDTNERGITAVVSIGDYDMLVTGDASKSAEKELLERHPLRDLELLIVGHHGSRYSSSGELLGSIGADTAVISVGYNTFGHPTYETLERLAAYGYNIYRTDCNGTIEIRIGDQDGETE